MDQATQLSSLIEYVPLFLSVLAVVIGMFCIRDIGRMSNVLKEKTVDLKSSSVGGAIEILREEIKMLKDKLEKVDEQVAELFLTTMTPQMSSNLKKICDPNGFGHFVKSEGLERELYHLREIGYIQVGDIGDIPHEGDNLSVYVTPTLVGQNFVELHEEAKQRSSYEEITAMHKSA